MESQRKRRRAMTYMELLNFAVETAYEVRQLQKELRELQSLILSKQKKRRNKKNKSRKAQ